MKVHFFLALYFVLTTSPLHAAESLTFSAIEDSTNTLISARVLKEAYKRINIEIIIEKYPAARALQYSNAGHTDGELFRVGDINKKYSNLLMIPVPINTLEGLAFSKQVRLTASGWHSLKPYKVGIRRGIKFSEKGVHSVEGIYTQVVARNEQLFRLLEAGRVDIIILARLNGLETSKKLQIPSGSLLTKTVEDYPLYHYLHKKHRHLVPEITATLIEMKKEGLIKKIREDFITENFYNYK